MFLSYFKSPLVIISMFAGTISVFLGGWVDAGIIYFVVGMSVILGFYQESKAEAVRSETRLRLSF